jgi:hypothetical protein
VISVASSGGAVIVNGAPPAKTSSTPMTTAPPQNTWPVIIVGTSTITENSNSQIIIGSQTLTPGGEIVYGGKTLSLSPSDGVVVVTPSSLSTFVTKTQAGDSPVPTVVLGGQTLAPGGVVTVGGDVLSLGASGTQILIIGTVTVGGVTTATGTGTKKSAGEKIGSDGWLVALQFSFTVLAFWFW